MCVACACCGAITTWNQMFRIISQLFVMVVATEELNTAVKAG